MISYIRIFVLFMLGMFIAIFAYPFLHEAGHALAVLAVGSECCKISILPFPYVLCDMSSAAVIDYYIVGVAGILFPLLFMLLLIPLGKKSIYMGYSAFIIEGITALAGVVSIISVLILKCGYEFVEDDIVNIIIRTNASETAIIITVLFLIFIVALSLIMISKQKIISKTVSYLMR